MSFDSRFVDYKGDVGELALLQHLQHVSMQVGLRHLHTDIQHPNVIEGELAVVASEDVQLALDDISSVSTARPRSVITRLYLLPMILFDIKHMHIVHPVSAIITSEIVYLRVNEAARS